MLTGAVEEREGVLLRRLKDVSHGSRPAGFGFNTGAENGTKRRPMLVVARLAASKKLPTELQALASAGADGIEIIARSNDDKGIITSAVDSVEAPCGIFLDGDSDYELSGIDSTALDWIHVSSQTRARLLKGKGPTRVISLAPDMPPNRLPGLSGLKADVIVVDSDDANTHLTVDTLLAICTIELAIKGPVLVSNGLGITPDDVETLHESGIEGILVSGGTATVKDFIKAIEAL